MVDRLIRAVVGVILPPLAMFMERGIKVEFWIDLLLTFLGIVPGTIYFFHVMGLDIIKNICCYFLPPLAVFLHCKCRIEFWISILLALFFWIPGVIYAYYVVG